MAGSAYAYLTAPAMRQSFRHLGYPDYFRVELAVAKLLGVALLLAPVGARPKEWAYAGFAFTLVAAFVAHAAVGDPLALRLNPLYILALLLVSYFAYHRLRQAAPSGDATLIAAKRVAGSPATGGVAG